MSKKADNTVLVISPNCTTTFPDLDIEIPAGVPTPIPSSLLPRALAAGVVTVNPDPTTPPSPEE